MNNSDFNGLNKTKISLIRFIPLCLQAASMNTCGKRLIHRLHTVFKFTFFALFVINSGLVGANENIPDRRKDQFPKIPAYLLVPLPYSYPGIGQGAFLMGNFSNLFNTTTDFLAMYVVGDAGGYIGLLDEAPLINERLFLSVYYQNINRAVVNNYDIRGMEGTNKDDFNLLDMSLALQRSAELSLSFFDRRLEFGYSYSADEYEIQAIRDHDGKIISELDEPFVSEETSQHFSVTVDLTDDFLDPKRGLRFSLGFVDFPAKHAEDPSYYVLSYKALAYIPMFESDTLVLNYYQSDAHVRKKGNTNEVEIRDELGLDCEPTDTECLETEQKLVDSFVNRRTNGTAASLGGNERLRSYPQGRFNGGHTAFFGAEYRWNFVQETKPFNYLFWKDVRTGIQLALFAEMGSVAEKERQIWSETRYSYGAGVRLVAGSGSVYRADVAYGDEGAEVIIFFFYPWEE